MQKHARSRTEESRQMDTEDQMVVFAEQVQRDTVAYNLDASYPYPEPTSFLSRSYLLLRNMIKSDSPSPKTMSSPKKEVMSIKLKLSSESKA